MFEFLQGYNIFVTLTVIVLIYSIVFWWSSPEIKVQWVTYLSNFSVMTALIGFILSQINAIETRKSDEKSQFNKQQESGYVEIEKLFLKYYPELFPLYKEMNYANTWVQKFPIPKNIDPVKRAQYETNMFNIITQKIENILMEMNSIEEFQKLPSYNEWLQTWQQWFKSPTMQTLWKINRPHYFMPQTISFIDNYVIGHTENQTGGRQSMLSKGRLSHIGSHLPYF